MSAPLWVIQCGLLSNKYVNQALKPKPLDSHVIQAVSPRGLQTMIITTLDTLVRSGALLSPSLVMGDDVPAIDNTVQ